MPTTTKILEQLIEKDLIDDTNILDNKYVFTKVVNNILVLGYIKEVPDNDAFFENSFNETLKENDLTLLNKNKNKVDYIDTADIDSANSADVEKQVINEVKETNLIPLEQSFSLKDLAKLQIPKNINEISNKVVAFIEINNTKFNELNSEFKKTFNRNLTNDDKYWLIDKLQLNNVINKFNNLLNGEIFYIDLELFDENLTVNLLDGMTNKDYSILVEKIIDPLDKSMPVFYNFDTNDINSMKQHFNEMCQKVANQFDGENLLKQSLELELDKVNPLDYTAEEYLLKCQIAIKRNGYYIKYVSFENLPKENNRQIYAQLCQIAVESNNYALEGINFENLPLENNREIYAKLCQNAVEWGDMEVLKFINVENLPKENKEQIYFDLCQTATLNDPWALEFVNTDYLSESNYFKLCNNEEIIYSYHGASETQTPFSYINIDKLSSQNYLTLCKKAMEDNKDNIQYIEPKYFPIEQASDNYILMCQEAIMEVPEFIINVKTQYLPETMQNLEGDDLKNAILNYIPSINKGLSM